MALMPFFDVACALLVVAGVAKLRSPAATRESLAVVGVRLPALAVRALGAAELALGSIAAARPAPVTAGLVALAYGVFAAFVVRLLRLRDRPTGCGCFGDADAGAGATHVTLNIIACVVGVAAAIAPPPGLTWLSGQRPLVVLPLTLGTATAAAAAYLTFTDFPRAWRAYRR
jgi:hypothetical protein